MRRHDPQQQKGGFTSLRDHSAEHLDELITEFDRALDHGMRCWLLELIGEARSRRALTMLVDQLHRPDEALHHWAARDYNAWTRRSPDKSSTGYAPTA